MRKLLPKIVSHPNGFTLIKAGRLEQVQWRSSFERVKGFTLIELMVVISIIAVLSVIGITLYNGVQKNSRDARKKADVDSISSAFEANYSSGSATPYGIPSSGWFSSGSIPKDPSNNQYYWNGSQVDPTTLSAASGYVICTSLENANGNSSTQGSASGNPPIYSFTGATGASATFYCKKNQQ